jgi:A/G-specific adenine glycosylase
MIPEPASAVKRAPRRRAAAPPSARSHPVDDAIPSRHARAIRAKLLRWFAAHARDLPWRAAGPDGRRDPYRVWLAEVMLQQTQAATVVPYYERWLARFPALADLAAAPLDDVLKQWEGLGYYARARNFHRAARAVMDHHGGRVPDTVEALRALPGIGRYTAGAIASLAFGRDAPALDGNIRRVLSRLFAVGGAPAAADSRLWALSEALLPEGRAGEFNEALMDLGASLCAPRAPACPRCPLRAHCLARAAGNPEAYPPRRARAPLPHRLLAAAVLRAPDGELLLAQRPARGLLGGLWEFPGGEIDASGPPPEQQLSAILRRRAGLRTAVRASHFIGQVRRAFTHFRITRWVAVIDLPNQPLPKAGAALRWVPRGEIDRLALARSDRDILALVANARHPSA